MAYFEEGIFRIPLKFDSNMERFPKLQTAEKSAASDMSLEFLTMNLALTDKDEESLRKSLYNISFGLKLADYGSGELDNEKPRFSPYEMLLTYHDKPEVMRKHVMDMKNYLHKKDRLFDTDYKILKKYVPTLTNLRTFYEELSLR